MAEAMVDHSHFAFFLYMIWPGFVPLGYIAIRMTDDVSSLVWHSLGALRGTSKMAHQRPNARLSR